MFAVITGFTSPREGRRADNARTKTMKKTDSSEDGESIVRKAQRIRKKYQFRAAIAVVAGAAFFTSPGLAQDGFDICSTELVDIIVNILNTAVTLGPLIGLIGAIVGLVMQGQVSNKSSKQQWKQRRNQSFLYGVLGVLLAGTILQFFFSLTGAEAGSCGEFSVIPGF